MREEQAALEVLAALEVRAALEVTFATTVPLPEGGVIKRALYGRNRAKRALPPRPLS